MINMNRILILLVLTALTTTNTFGQDLIVTTNNDTINCKITKIKKEYIYFTFSQNGDIRNTLLPLNEVNIFTENYYSYSEVSAKDIKKNDVKHGARFAFNTGPAFRIAKIPDDFSSDAKDVIRDLKSGVNISSDLHFFSSETTGWGAKYSLFKSSATSGSVKDNLTIHYLGPSMVTRLRGMDKQTAWILGVSLGYMTYKEKMNTNNNESWTGGTFGSSAEIGYEFKVSEQTWLGIQVSVVSGILRKFTYNSGTRSEVIELDSDEYEGLGRIDLSVGIRFGK